MNKKEIRMDIVFISILILVMIAAAFILPKYDVEAVRSLFVSAGIYAPIAYMFIMFLAIIISPIPSLPLVVIAGGVFGGSWQGFILS